MATEADLQQWAGSMGFTYPTLGQCVGQVYANSHGGALPTKAELCAWIPSSGIVKADGSWECNLQVSGPIQQGAQTIWSGLRGIWETNLPQVRAWIYQHPAESVGAGVVLYLILMQASVHPWTRPLYRKRQTEGRRATYLQPQKELSYG